MTAIVAGLGGAVFAGLFGFIVAWYTNNRAEEDRAERAQVRAEERVQQDKSRMHEQGMDAVNRFISAVTRIQTDAYFYKTSPQQLTGHISEMEAARWGIAAYFPGTLYEMTDMTRMATLALTREIAKGDKDVGTKSTEALTASLHTLMSTLHIELGHAFAVEEQERLRANPTPLNEDC